MKTKLINDFTNMKTTDLLKEYEDEHENVISK